MITTSRSMLTGFGLAAALMASASVNALEVDKAIEYRQDALRVMAFQTGPLGNMAQGNIDYDAETFALRANNLAAVAHLPWEAFIEGSLMGDGHGIETDAAADIASNMDDFMARADRLSQETGTLAQMANDGEEFGALRQQLGAVVNTCRSCHDHYRDN